MKITTRNLLISSLCAFLVCLIASTATTVVFAEESNVAEEEPYWGNLKAGDEMRWNWSPNFAGSATEEYYELEILELQGESLKGDYHAYYTSSSFEKYTSRRGSATWIFNKKYHHPSPGELWPWIYPAALIQENKDVTVTTYEYNESTYVAAYLKEESSYSSDVHYEYWWDYSTGILFAYESSPCDYGCSIGHKLEYTNANLTIPEPYQFNPGGSTSLDPIVIALVVIVALVSIVIVVLYRRTRYQKTKNT